MGRCGLWWEDGFSFWVGAIVCGVYRGVHRGREFRVNFRR